jgi:hypothetical protein
MVVVVVPAIPSYRSVPTQQQDQQLNSGLCDSGLLFRGGSCYRVMGESCVPCSLAPESAVW